MNIEERKNFIVGYNNVINIEHYLGITDNEDQYYRNICTLDLIYLMGKYSSLDMDIEFALESDNHLYRDNEIIDKYGYVVAFVSHGDLHNHILRYGDVLYDISFNSEKDRIRIISYNGKFWYDQMCMGQVLKCNEIKHKK